MHFAQFETRPHQSIIGWTPPFFTMKATISLSFDFVQKLSEIQFLREKCNCNSAGFPASKLQCKTGGGKESALWWPDIIAGAVFWAIFEP